LPCLWSNLDKPSLIFPPLLFGSYVFSRHSSFRGFFFLLSFGFLFFCPSLFRFLPDCPNFTPPFFFLNKLVPLSICSFCSFRVVPLFALPNQNRSPVSPYFFYWFFSCTPPSVQTERSGSDFPPILFSSGFIFDFHARRLPSLLQTVFDNSTPGYAAVRGFFGLSLVFFTRKHA